MTKDKFIHLVEEWNQSHTTHPENIIKDFVWNGEKSLRFGNDYLWLQIVDLDVKQIIAVRYEKHTDDGVTWDTDYIYNYGEMKLSIQLSRSYSEQQILINAKYSTPHFITLLIEKGYLEKDLDLPISNTPITLADSKMQVLADVIINSSKYDLPVVFVSKTHDNHDPIDVTRLAAKLKGVAHVFIQPDVEQCLKLRELCKGREAYWGMCGVYLPNANGHWLFSYKGTTGYDEEQYSSILHCILQYTNIQTINPIYTWQGIDLENRTDEIINDLGMDEQEYKNELESKEKTIRELKNKVFSLENENKALNSNKSHYDSGTPVLYYGAEREFFDGEIRDVILSTLDTAIKNLPENTRRRHILESIMESNKYQHILEERASKLREILKGMTNMTPPIESSLKALGLIIINNNKHHKLKYYEDSRYVCVLPCSGSDWRCGENASKDIAKQVF
ncbi:MAG: hypothetical protein PHN24_05085 [Eubacteriales bacterium]|nr:hypothetical protein [Eubacteriales bacterium]